MSARCLILSMSSTTVEVDPCVLPDGFLSDALPTIASPPVILRESDRRLTLIIRVLRSADDYIRKCMLIKDSAKHFLLVRHYLFSMTRSRNLSKICRFFKLSLFDLRTTALSLIKKQPPCHQNVLSMFNSIQNYCA